MARKNKPIPLLTDQDASGNFTLPAAGQEVSLLNPFTVEVSWTGTLTGNAQLQSTIDEVIWASEGAAINLGGAPGNSRVTVTNVVKAVRIDRNTAGGAGDLSALILGLPAG